MQNQRPSTLCVLVVLGILGAVACNKDKASSTSTSSAGSPASGAAGGNLTVDAYCSAFCTKLCGTCGDSACGTTCKPPCYHGREGTMLMDGHDPKIALARTQKDLDGCLATINAATCPKIMSGQAIPPACYTIQH